MPDHHIPTDHTKAVTYKVINVSCPAFKQNETIPHRYTCDGDDLNPQLNLEHIPVEAQSLAIIVDDPDAPRGTWVHWVIWNIPVTHQIKENNVPGIEGINDSGEKGYSGPCPPPSGTHRYFFKVYALDGELELPATARKPDLEKAMAGHIIAFGELIGLYQRGI